MDADADPMNMDTVAISKGRIPSLDGVRAISIFLVLVAHACGTLHQVPFYIEPILPILSNGGLGVAIFFGISGFLITHFLVNELDATRDIDIQAFYVRRAFRILPAFYLYCGFIWALGILGVIGLKTRDLVGAVLFIWNYNFQCSNWFLGHTWSLSVEEQFYLLWPLTFYFLRPKRAVVFAIILAVISPATRILAYILFTSPSAREHIPIMLHTRIDALMVGCLSAMLYSKPAFQRILQSIYRVRVHWAAGIFLFVLDPFLHAQFRGGYGLSIGYSMQSVSIMILILWVIQYHESFLGRILNSQVMSAIGVMSYSLYLWQQLFLTPLNRTLTGVFPLNIVCCFAAASVSYFAVEQPFLRLRARVLQHRKPLSLQAAVVASVPMV